MFDSGSINLSGDALLSASSLAVQNGGSVTISSGGTAAGVIVGSGGREFVSSGGTVSAPIISGGLLDLTFSGIVTGMISFAGTGGTLEIDGTVMPSNTIAGVGGGDVIDLRALPFSSTNTAVLSGSTLTVSGGGIADILTLSGVAGGTQFTTSDDGNGGTAVTAVSSSTTWTNISGGNWTVASNWSGGVPNSSINATIGTAGTYTDTLSGTAGNANSLTINNAAATLAVLTSGEAQPALRSPALSSTPEHSATPDMAAATPTNRYPWPASPPPPSTTPQTSSSNNPTAGVG